VNVATFTTIRRGPYAVKINLMQLASGSQIFNILASSAGFGRKVDSSLSKNAGQTTLGIDFIEMEFPDAEVVDIFVTGGATDTAVDVRAYVDAT